ncbi:MAG TPA: aminopeptidase, partial [Bacillota bacterium]|nr:aminopeptidase [Bacillota bacterium]
MEENKESQSRFSLKRASTWERLTQAENQQLMDYALGYKEFLDQGKTERECIDYIVERAQAAGFVNLDSAIAAGQRLKPGDRVYAVNRHKGAILAVIGTEPLEQGLNILGSHVDSPRLDLKPNPLYEAEKMAWLKTHYYGGIKKYQWLTLPLALHGVVFTGKGEKVRLVIGESPEDPVFTVPDLLPHLAKDQMEKKLREAVSGEGLNLLVGSIPVKDEKVKERIKEQVLTYLNAKYGMIEEDFLTA